MNCLEIHEFKRGKLPIKVKSFLPDFPLLILVFIFSYPDKIKMGLTTVPILVLVQVISTYYRENFKCSKCNQGFSVEQNSPVANLLKKQLGNGSDSE
jgi:hypothetical protein